MKLEPQSDEHETDSEQHETASELGHETVFNMSYHSEAAPVNVSPLKIRCDPLHGNGLRDDSLDLLLTKFFIENDIPFKAVKSSYLAKFIEKLRPEYKLPNPNVMKTSILGKIHEEAMSKAKPSNQIAFIKTTLWNPKALRK